MILIMGDFFSLTSGFIYETFFFILPFSQALSAMFGPLFMMM